MELTIEWVLTRPLGKLEVGIDNDKQTGQLSTILNPLPMHACCRRHLCPTKNKQKKTADQVTCKDSNLDTSSIRHKVLCCVRRNNCIYSNKD